MLFKLLYFIILILGDLILSISLFIILNYFLSKLIVKNNLSFYKYKKLIIYVYMVSIIFSYTVLYFIFKTEINTIILFILISFIIKISKYKKLKNYVLKN